jgi:hypothetical protein
MVVHRRNVIGMWALVWLAAVALPARAELDEVVSTRWILAIKGSLGSGNRKNKPPAFSYQLSAKTKKNKKQPTFSNPEVCSWALVFSCFADRCSLIADRL